MRYMFSIPELNVIKKNWRKTNLKIALCYPNVYRAGMSGLTVKLLYALFNVQQDVLCERCFMPTLNEPLRSLESGFPLKNFDVVAFTLQYEEDYLNVLRMLLMSDIPPRRIDRGFDNPLVIAGGPCATANPEPLADFIDFFVIGELEPILDALVDKIGSFENPKKHLEEYANIKGVYVSDIQNPTERVWVRKLDDAPQPLAQQIPLVEQRSPYMTVFGKAFTLEAVRGCSRNCRFCLARNITQPKRERSYEKLQSIIAEGIFYTPVKKISLVGAGIFDYSRLEDLCDFIVSRSLDISIPSLRPETITERLAIILAKGKQRTVSLAPDAASPRMWKIINKGLDDESIVDAAKILIRSHVKRLKLYFIIGFPEETIDDVEAIASLSKKIAEIGYGSRAIHLSINPLIPKPHTPFQWEAAPSVSYFREALGIIRKRLGGDSRFVISSLDPRRAQIQTFLSQGDRRIGETIEMVTRFGGGFGGWRRALKETKVSLKQYIGEKSSDAHLPWDKIDTGFGRVEKPLCFS